MIKILEGTLKRKTSVNGQEITFQTKDIHEVDKFFSKNINKPVSVDFKVIRERRSHNANALFWHCVQELSTALRTSKDEVYLQLLKRYGQYTYIAARPHAVEALKRQWKEVEVIGEVEVNGEKAIQLLCYFGSSSYDTKEFSRLLDGTISEMREMGLDAPGDDYINDVIKELEKTQEKQQGGTE